MATLIYTRILKTAARCRNLVLRAAGTPPSEALRHYTGRAKVPGDMADGPAPWRYLDGNRSDRALLVERGLWQPVAQGPGDLDGWTPEPGRYRGYNARASRYETHAVWHMLCRWRCAVDGTTEEPGTGLGWAMTAFLADIRLGWTLPGQKSTRWEGHAFDIIPSAKVGWNNEPVSPLESMPVNWRWSRRKRAATDSSAEQDAAWRARTTGTTLHVDASDLTYQGSDGPQTVVFTLTGRPGWPDEKAWLPLEDSTGDRITDRDGSPLFNTGKPGAEDIIQAQILISVY